MLPGGGAGCVNSAICQTRVDWVVGDGWDG